MNRELRVGHPPGSFNFTYDTLSRRTQMTRPNGVNTNYTYDSLSRLLSVLHQTGASTIDGANYTVDATGNRTSKTDQMAGVTSNYAYDAIYELTQVTQAANTTENYTYDAAGNRLSSLAAATASYNASNQLTSNSNATYSYDANGNTTSKTDSTGTTSYTWDFENRLTGVTLPGAGSTVSFKYDPMGRRIEKVSSSTTSIYAYDGDGIAETTDAAGNVSARYTQGQSVDEPLAMLQGGLTNYYNADGLGSVTSLTNAAGAATQTYTYDSFGNLLASTGSVGNPFRYTGREFDPETGLYFYRARYFDSAAGRFLSEDPIGPLDTSNLYAYVSNRPTVAVDPSGRVTVIPLPETHIHRKADIDRDCTSGDTAGGCENVDYAVSWTCDCDGGSWRAKVTITLTGNIYVATGPFPYKGRQPQDRSVTSTETALAHEMLHVNDKLAAIKPIFERFESQQYASHDACETAGTAAAMQASPLWVPAGRASQGRRH